MPEQGTAPTSSKDLIAASAKRLFEESGFAAVTVRAIAADAGVDPSLVIRHFGSKEALFLDVLGLDRYVRPPIEGPLESLGRRLAGFVLATEHEELRTHLATLVRASDREAIREGLHLSVRRLFIDGLVEVLPGEDREVRAQLIAAQLGGLVQSSDAIEVEVLGRVSQERLVELYGLAIQALVDLG